MTKEELLKLKEWIKSLSDDEMNERKIYLSRLAKGELIGPSVGYASIDRPWLKSYKTDVIIKNPPEMKMFDYLFENNRNNLECIAIDYFGKK